MLISGDDVRKWIGEVVAQSGHSDSDEMAREVVDYLSKRSGLLLPRGPDHFGFVHKSFQEFFAACFLFEKIVSPQ